MPKKPKPKIVEINQAFRKGLPVYELKRKDKQS